MDMAVTDALVREIFVIDDDPNIHDVLSAAFAFRGFRVVSFFDGSSFLAAANVRPPVFVLLDINMPHLSGLDILRQVDAWKYPLRS